MYKFCPLWQLMLGKDLLCQKSSNSICMCMGGVYIYVCATRKAERQSSFFCDEFSHNNID
ncbi:hypothetical protein T4D_8516 [Trichinella pseudospiralis]|uniref:Uncharacterized protein n=1 Tax=Trichinella pseudospiralis TaxID=6337 RepID=A0A0V1G7Z5_TRIPS|nr:hypothetical protein T4D_8516 [Trichinella pseudospiralis]